MGAEIFRKGWICKTWEGEMAMVSMPGAATETFAFTVRENAWGRRSNKLMGRRVALHYEQKVGSLTSCFGDTRSFGQRKLTARGGRSRCSGPSEPDAGAGGASK